MMKTNALQVAGSAPGAITSGPSTADPAGPRACVVTGSRRWGEAMAGALSDCGWSVSIEDDLPCPMAGIRVLILRRPSLSASLELASRAVATQRFDGAAVVVLVPPQTSPSNVENRYAQRGSLSQAETPHDFLQRLWRVPREEEPATALRAGPFRLDVRSRRAWAGGRELALTKAEFEILSLLAHHADRPVSHDEIRTAVLGGHDRIETSRVRTQLSNLRKKLSDYAAFIETVVPRHYRIRTEPTTSKVAGTMGARRRCPGL